MLIATDYTILRDMVPGKGKIAVEREPIRVATMIDETLFESSGHQIRHNQTVFLEDRMHDWNWQDGLFRYYTRVVDVGDVLLIFAEKEILFCTQCGSQISETTAGVCENCKKASIKG